MIDPLRVTNFERTLHEAEEFLAFVILGAGKDSDRAAAATADLLRGKPASLAPYAWLRRLGRNRIAGRLVASRFGQQHQKSKYLHGTAVLVADRDVRDVREFKLADLMPLPGLGMMTARMFPVHSRRDGPRHAVLDVMSLRVLRRRGVPRVPAQTLCSAREYLRLERAWLRYCDRTGRHLAELDLEDCIRESSRPTPASQATSA